MRRLLVDVQPLRDSRQFRLLYVGEMLSFVGTQVTVVAVPIQVYRLTGSSFAVGMVGFAGSSRCWSARCSAARSPTPWTGGGCCSSPRCSWR